MRQPEQPSIADRRQEREVLARARALADPRLIDRASLILAAAMRDWRRAPAEVARGIRDAHRLPSPERRLLSEMVHGWIRFRRRLAYLAQTESLRQTLLVWLADTHAEAELSPELAEALRKAGVDASRVADAAGTIAQLHSARERLAVGASYPDWIVERVCGVYGDISGTALLESMNRRAPLTVRVNRLKTDRDALAARLLELGIPSAPTKLAPDGLVLDTTVNVYSLEPWKDGSMELQDEGSQLVAELVAPPPRSVIVDACAGAGGKTLALGAVMQNRGRVLACDVAEWKLTELRQRVRRAGLTNVEAKKVEPGKAPPFQPGSAERVLVDAPCTGLGVVRRNPETKWRLSPEEPEELQRTQLAILDAYAPLVCPGGRMVYATCSVLPDENDVVVEKFLSTHDGWQLVPAKEILGRERAAKMGDGERLRLLPHVHDTDGFYAAVLRRRA